MSSENREYKTYKTYVVAEV